MLSSQEVRFFFDNGYLRLPDRIEQSLVDRLDSALTHLLHSRSWMIDQTKIYGIDSQLPEIRHCLISHEKIVAPLRSLLGPNVVFVRDRHNYASVISDPTSRRLHRDVPNWSRGLITVVLYLQDSYPENGCTYVLPGSHVLPDRRPFNQVDGIWLEDDLESQILERQMVPVPMAKGTLLAMNSSLFHAAGRPKSTAQRRSVVLAYRAADELDRKPDTFRARVVAGSQNYTGNPIDTEPISADLG